MGVDRILEHRGRIVPLQYIGLVQRLGRAGQHGDGERGDDQLREIDGEGAARQPIDRRARRLLRQRIADIAQRHAGQQNEQLRRVGQGIMAESIAFEENAGNVIDENRRQGESAPEIDGVGRLSCRARSAREGQPRAAGWKEGGAKSHGERGGSKNRTPAIAPPEKILKSEKLVPQPQEAVALGLSILKDWPIRSSTKSIFAPLSKSSDTRIDRQPRLGVAENQVAVLGRGNDVEGVLEAGTAAAIDRDPQESARRLAAQHFRDPLEGVFGWRPPVPPRSGSCDSPKNFSSFKDSREWATVNARSRLFDPGAAMLSARAARIRAVFSRRSALSDAPAPDFLHVKPLAPYAADWRRTRGRLLAEPASPTRGDFQRDRDRLIHSTAFRRLAHKTQVFVQHEGDHFRTRLTHTIEVAQIARALARGPAASTRTWPRRLALAHDLGHTCFGHAGEDVLDACMAPFGGFDHNAQPCAS